MSEPNGEEDTGNGEDILWSTTNEDVDSEDYQPDATDDGNGQAVK